MMEKQMATKQAGIPLGHRDRNLLDEINDLCFRPCYYCDGLGKLPLAKDGEEQGTLHMFIRSLPPISPTTVTLVKCEPCEGEGTLITHWGVELSKLIKSLSIRAEQWEERERQHNEKVLKMMEKAKNDQDEKLKRRKDAPD